MEGGGRKIDDGDGDGDGGGNRMRDGVEIWQLLLVRCSLCVPSSIPLSFSLICSYVIYSF